jgi:hypothetical protein
VPTLNKFRLAMMAIMHDGDDNKDNEGDHDN